ncbi:hypothetical protein OIV83_004119 [Microbotryomycetes sp. JL201]|nr:hypothetical protein OIV83_004119 [Microbotryomycetes sp. JL201]
MPFVSVPGGTSLYVQILRAGRPSQTSGSTAAPATRRGLNSGLAPLSVHDASDSDSDIDRTRPTLIVLSHLFQDITSQGAVASDPRIRAEFNVVCIDQRHHGRSKCLSRPEYDGTVGAADIAFVVEALLLPPSFVYAPSCTAWSIAVKLAVLFPELVLGLFGAGIVGMHFEPQRFTDLDSSFMTPLDEDDFDDALTAFVGYLFPDPSRMDKAIIDEHIGVLVRRYGPPNASAYASIRTHCHPFKLSPATLAQIRQPIMALGGENDLAFTPSDMQEAVNAFTSAIEKTFEAVDGGSHLIAASHAQLIADRVYEFVARHSAGRPIATPVQIDFHRALRTVSDLTRDPSVLRRNVRRPESFTVLDETETSKMAQLLARVLTDSITIAVERAQAEEFDDSESGSSVPSTPTTVPSLELLNYGLREKDQTKRASVPFQLYQVRI